MSDSDLVVSLSYPLRIICVHLIVRSGPAKLLTYLLIFRREAPNGTSALESADGRFSQRTASKSLISGKSHGAAMPWQRSSDVWRLLPKATCLGRFLDGESREIAQFDQSALFRIKFGEAGKGGVERHQVDLFLL